MEFNRDEFGKRVKQARMDKHLTQVQLADLLGVEWQQISRIERGFSGCSNELLVPLSEALDVSTDFLLKGVESDSELLRKQISLLMDQLSIFKSQIK
jgi:transcriptional regulator with XRE-family HTH domain